MNEIIYRPLPTVGGLILNSEGEILLVQSKKWADRYSVPGGKIEKGETREEAFRREVLEETGLNVINIRPAMVQDCIFSSEFWAKEHFVMNDFIADLDPAFSKEDVMLNEEAYAYLWIDPKKALSLNLHNECRVLIEWFLKHGAASKFAFIGIEGYKISCLIGIHPEERLKEQSLLIDLKLKVDLSRFHLTQELEDSVDYTLLAAIALDLAKKNHYFLIETFAEDLLKECFDRFRTTWGFVKIRKPGAIPSGACAFVELERSFKEV